MAEEEVVGEAEEEERGEGDLGLLLIGVNIRGEGVDKEEGV